MKMLPVHSVDFFDFFIFVFGAYFASVGFSIYLHDIAGNGNCYNNECNAALPTKHTPTATITFSCCIKLLTTIVQLSTQK